MALKNEDTVAGGFIAAIGTLVAYLSLDIRAGATANTLPPNFFPLLCSLGLVICGLVIMLRGLRAEARPLPALVDWRVAVVGGMAFVFYWFFADIDFRVGAAALTVVTMWAFGIRSVMQLVLVPSILSIGLYYAFTRGFQLVLPIWT
ncbi:tripartite tricarboxylate transporter TctB family protein [Roseitranquillus sediminis]|uniref:tripartite tricarboxylate transporter TctB family protein n=1 Tax=Roseitranquillus sediminis TaxID=2809051 RepID=UPI001D0C1766|nr:tripartite tricarboxylate transporter TctB family protein [Roseitranquillus sediminis]MBM9593177.1 tripartite tricarboxylate transporter TctB family protein [Roseitranquillus sediminis]